MKRLNSLGDVFKLISGTTVAQLLMVATAPWLARLYTPESFGVLNIFISIATLASVVVCLRYEMAILLPSDNRQAANLFWGSVGVALLMSAVSVPAVIIGKIWVAQFVGSAELSQNLWLLPISLLFGGVLYGHPSLNYWAMRSSHFGELALARVTSTAGVVLLQLAAGVAGYASGRALIDAAVIGGALSAIVLAAQLWRADGKFLVEGIDLHQIGQSLVRYRKFPLYGSWAILINNLSWLLPSFILARFFTLTEVGLYGITSRFLGIPMTLMGAAVAQVLFQRASIAKAEDSLGTVVESALRRLIAVGMFPILLMTMIAPALFRVFFGLQWAEAGVYAQITGVWTLVWFVSSPLHNMYSVLEKQDSYLAFNVISLIARFIALVTGSMLGSARLALLFFALSGILTYGYQIIKISEDTGVQRSRVTQIAAIYLLKFLPAGAVLLLAKLIHTADLGQIGLAFLLLAVYAAIEMRKSLGMRGLLQKLAWNAR